MANTKTREAVAFASATTTSTGEELLGRLVAFRPIEVKDIETKVGVSTATIAQVVEIDPDGTGTDLGERPVFWMVVRRQIAAATREVPWIVGRLVQSGQAYRLDPLTDADLPVVRKALGGLFG